MPVLFIGVFMSALDTAVIGPAIPALREAFEVDNRQVGLVMTVFILCSLCSTALMASLSDRYGRRPIYLTSVALFALGSFLIALSPRFWMIVASRAIQGVGAGGITPTASAVVGDTFPPAERGRALGLIGATYGMAFALGPPLASVLMVALNWRWIFVLNLPIAAVVLTLGRRLLPTLRPVANVRLAPAYVLAVGGGFGMGSIIFLTSIATAGFGVTSRHAGFVLLPLVIFSILGSAGSGRLLNRVGARGLLLAGFALLAAGYGASAITAYGLQFFLAASMPVGLGLGVVVGGALRSIAIDEAPPPLRATAQGLINIFNAMGTLTAAATIGAIADFRGGGAAGFSTAYVIVAIVMLAMLAVTLRLRRDVPLAANRATAEERP